MSTWMNISLQEAMSPIMEQLIMFHDHTILLITMITIMGFYVYMYMMLTLMLNKNTNRFLLESQMMVMVWTSMPAIMLIFIAMPSLHILYLIDEMQNHLITI